LHVQSSCLLYAVSGGGMLTRHFKSLRETLRNQRIKAVLRGTGKCGGCFDDVLVGTMMKRKVLKVLFVCICSAVFFYPNTVFGIDWEQWRIPDNSSIPDAPAPWFVPADPSHGVEQPAPRQEREDTQKREALKLNKKGNQAYRAGNWKKAIEYYKKALRKSPNDRVIRQNLTTAQSALAKEDTRKKEEDLQKRKEDTRKSEAFKAAKFEQGKKEILTQLKGESGGGSLSLKGREGTLALKSGNVPSANQGAGKTGQVKTGGKDPEAKKEQFEFENFNDDWMKKQKQLIAQRLKKPNKWCSGIHASLMGKVPPLPYKKFNELEAGDVLLFDDGLIPISVIDNYFSGDKVSNASHTVSYLKEVNGKKLFLDNQPGEGPRIISEDVFLEKYGSRSAEVARLVGQPVSNEETKDLFTAAVKMAQKNRNAGGTNYGVWGKDDLVCSEASWALLKATDRKIPKSDDQIKVAGGIGFSPADFQDSRYFLVTPVYMSK